MKDILQKLLNAEGEGCVTIIASTHRVKTGIKQDELTIKNLVKEAEDRLLGMYEKKFAESIINNIHKAIGTIDFSKNLDALMIFAGPTISEYITLPTEVKNRVVIDKTFATRDLIRAKSETPSYYILVLSRKFARLIIAQGERVLQEIGSPFPLYNEDYERLRSQLPPDRLKASALEGFYHSVDKALSIHLKNKPLPLIIAAGVRNYAHFEKITSMPDMIAGNALIKSTENKAHTIVAEAWPIVVKMLQEYNKNRIKNMEKAMGSGKLLSDYNEVWNALISGRGRVLFVKKGFHQPAALTDGKIALIEKVVKDAKGVVEDIIDEMIEQCLAHGGEVVYVEGNELDCYNGIALITRY